jgi:hypothetical protein
MARLDCPGGAFVKTFAGQVIVGGVVSTTIMFAVHELEAPRSSTTVNVTKFVPLRYGPAGLSTRLTIVPSGSNEPLSTAAGETFASQLATAFVVIFRQTATGWALLWATVTVNEQLFVFPEVSVAAQVTSVIPNGNTEPDGGELFVERIPQLSNTTGAE